MRFRRRMVAILVLLASLAARGEAAPQGRVVEVTPVPVGDVPASDPAAASTTPPRIVRPEVLLEIRRVTPAAVLATPAVVPPPPVVVGPPPGRRGGGMTHRRVDLRALEMLTVKDAAGLPTPVVDKGGRGPSANGRRIFDALRTAPGISLSADKLTSIYPEIYQDANPTSGLFYYLPARYVLSWEAEEGYGLRMIYGESAQPEAAGSVFMTARLTSGIEGGEVALLRNLLARALGPAGVPFTDLRPFPFSGTPSFSLKNDLGRFSVPPEKISIAAISDIAGDVDLSFPVDTVTKETIEVTLTQGLGLTGTATFSSAVSGGGEAFSRTVPVQIRIPDGRSFPSLMGRRGTTLENATGFPLVLKHQHFLTVGADGTPTVYSFALGNAVVPSQARAHIADAPIPAWLDGKALKAWIEYGVRDQDEAGLRQALDQVTLAVDKDTTVKVAFTTLTPFTDPGSLARILVDVRSKYFDSRNHAEAVRSVALTKDNQTVAPDPLFLTSGRRPDEVARPGDPLFSYRLTLVQPDGTVVGPGTWVDGERLEVYLGAAQVRPLLAHP